jgi:hypothetical protein
LLLLVLLCLGGVAVLFITGHIAFRPSPDTPEGAILAQKEMAKRNVDFAGRADSALNTVTWDTAQGKLLAAQAFHGRVVAGQAKLAKELNHLAEGTDGKRIASQEKWLDQFIVVHRRDRLSDDELAAQLRTIKTLLPVCQQALKEKIVLACDERFLAQVDAVHGTLAKAAREIDEDLQNLEVLVASSQAATPANQSLAAASRARTDEKQAQTLARFTIESERQRQEFEKAARERQLAAERELQEAKLAAEQKIREADLAREKAEQTLRVMEATTKSDQAKRDLKQLEDFQARERIRRERVAKFEAALPSMKPLLMPFISTGKMHYIPGKGWREGDPGPLSLTALQATRGLEDQPGSPSILNNFLLGNQSGNDRPIGSYPTWRPEAGPQIEREVRRVQAFLREYGDLLVERGMLQP